MRPVGRKANTAYRVRQHLTESEMDKSLAALKTNRHGHRDWPIGLRSYRHALRVSECCDLRWDDLDLSKRTVQVRRLKGSIDSVHFRERDELAGLRRLRREQELKSAYTFVNERRQPFGRMGIARMIERAGKAARFRSRHINAPAVVMPWPAKAWIPGDSSTTSGTPNTVRYTAMSPEPFKNIWR